MILDPNMETSWTSCYGRQRQITLSWSRLSDWMKCKRRVRLIHEGKKSKLVNARNFLAGNLVDHSMRKALTNAERDSEGRLLSLSLEELMAPLPAMWDDAINNPEKNRIYQWVGPDPVADQKNIINNAELALRNLHPIITGKMLGKRYIPEFRPEKMPVIGIPSLEDPEDIVYIRLFLAVDMAIQLEEDKNDPMGMGEWGLYDLKTTQTADYIDKTLPQLVFYDLAFNASTGKYAKEHALWTPLQDPKVKEVVIKDEHRMQVMDMIVSYCHGVWSWEDDFTDDEKNCYTCPTKAACPKVTQPITKDEQGISRIHFGYDSGSGKLHG